MAVILVIAVNVGIVTIHCGFSQSQKHHCQLISYSLFMGVEATLEVEGPDHQGWG